MKRAISLILALVLCLGLCACGDKNIELTIDNYDDYLTISANVFSAEYTSVPNGHRFYLRDERFIIPQGVTDTFTVVVEIEGVSPNFQYSDITLDVSINGHYYSCAKSESMKYGTIVDKHAFAQNFSIKCDINVAGDGKGEAVFHIPNDEVVPINNLLIDTEVVSPYEFSVEICGITGSIIPLQ